MWDPEEPMKGLKHKHNKLMNEDINMRRQSLTELHRVEQFTVKSPTQTGTTHNTTHTDTHT